MKKFSIKKWICLMSVFAGAAAFFLNPVSVLAEEAEELSYKNYQKLHMDSGLGTDVCTINATDYSEAKGTVEVTDEDKILTGEDGTVTYQINIKNAGMYYLQLEYMPAPGNENDIERNILIDGAVPFKQAQFVTFTRIWKDAEEIRQDINGNDIRPAQEEVDEWRTVYVYDSARYSNEPLAFYLESGEHTITIQGVREPMYLAKISVCPWENSKAYSEVKAEYAANGYKEVSAEPIKVQAEDMYQKSDYTLYQSSDKSSAITEPQDPSKVRLNYISGDKFKLAGQWITWQVEVPEDGLYELALRFKQNLLSGIYTSRTLKIDGEVPFAEAAGLQFNYSRDWQVKALGNQDENYKFYLTKGTHYVTMEVTLGEMADIIAEVDNSLTELNKIYREILLLTGAEADIYRDYNFDRHIPETIANMKVQSDKLAELSQKLEHIVGTKGEHVVALDKLSYQLNLMHENPEQIARNFGQFKDNIAGLADWVVTVSAQPLSIDYLLLTAPGAKLPKGEGGFFTSVGFEIKSFAMSFFTDYSTLGQTVEYDNASDDCVEVWITSGRDQANIIRQMINNTFTPQTGINVELKLVSVGTLLPAVLSGQGPDVALGNPIADPIQYAMRNAAIDLSKFDGFDEVADRFHESAMVSYSFEDAVYALPETQTFPMMFYRKDIFEELGLTPPNTWDEFFEVVAVLQRNNMEVGFPQGMPGMQIFLYQNGGSLYNENLTASTFADDTTLDAFQRMLDLFTTYRFPRDYSFSNRFRTGQMPLAIQDYTEYNSLSAFAPEIKGSWAMIPIPGQKGEEGQINRAAACNGTCAMMLRGASDEEKAWEFMKWWTTAESQAEFAKEMKSVLGKAAMYATANMDAIKSMPWTKDEYTALYDQWNHIVGTPEVPGNYYVTRSINFASVQGYTSGDVEELLDWVTETNEEITRKRKEFGLE
ncbi:MAG: extracellular solute-binding protein [Acetatifactor sp.]|nr:extracellular solute-binding protein [Acetatifactor sp.]